jgi:1-aminocyclopropane-1-carboxylate deaminase/D-cysteine desulfhydrase-like pyridoxal-dependent ACC family enzyme
LNTASGSAITSVNLAESPLQRLHSSFLENTGITLYVKRDDLIHPLFGGNKWRKLKYNLNAARETACDTLLTFGGAWSNHIYATAAAGNFFGFNTIGFIRGEKHSPLNPTLAFAEQSGMQLHYVDRKTYRNKNDSHYLIKLEKEFSNTYILPEGGSNLLALDGCKEIVTEINSKLNRPFDVICCACGTGATLAGLVVAMNTRENQHPQTAIGFSALKGGAFLAGDIEKFLQQANHCTTKKEADADWYIEDQFHFGGYARVNDQLIQFIQEFKSEYGIMLDAIYTAKMFYGLFELIKNRAFNPGTTIVAVHSGGLQGNKGFNLSIT